MWIYLQTEGRRHEETGEDGCLQVKGQGVEQVVPSEGNNSADTLFVNFSPPEKCEKVKFCSLSHILRDTSVQQS